MPDFPERPETPATISGSVTAVCELDGKDPNGDSVHLVDKTSGDQVDVDNSTKALKTLDQNPLSGYNTPRGAYEMLPNAPDAIYDGADVVAVAGTAVQLNGGSSQAIERGVLIRAKDTNGGKIFPGGSGVSSSSGAYLNAGESVFIPINNINKVYIDTDTNGDGVSWTAF